MIRAVASCALLGSFAAIARAEWRPLPDVLAMRGLRVLPGSVRWLESSGLGARRAIALARAHGGATDLYVVTARTGPGEKLISVWDVSNLTRSRDADEESLVTSGRYAAFATRVAGEVVAVTVLDTRGDALDVAADLGARIRGSITRIQKTGRSRGYGMNRYDLVHNARSVRLAFRGSLLAVELDGESSLGIDADGRRVVAGAELVRERPRRGSQTGNWITWAVDTVRAIPWIGPAPIAWAEGIAFRAEHVVAQARVATMGDHSQREVNEDLADVLRVRPTAATEAPVVGWPPPPLHGSIRPALAHEGEWSPAAEANDPFVQSNPGVPPAFYLTFVRTDHERPDARVYVGLWDPRQIEMHVAPGSEEPMGATGETGTGAIPRDDATMARVVGGFNGAFQALHGEFGVYGEGTLLLPAKPYGATVALMADGNIAFGTWPSDLTRIPEDITEFRQNMTALVDNGAINPWRRTWWGGIVGNPSVDLHTARTAICLTGEGFVGYFWGHAVTPQTLGAAMVAARCTYGLHLDMNGANTGFEFYRVAPPSQHRPLARSLVSNYEAEGTIAGMPGLHFRARKLIRSMTAPMPRYIRRDPRDFFYLLLRPVLPGHPIAPVVQPAQEGEGTWHVAGLGSLPFPWPMARTRLRPDAARPERWTNLVRIDPRRVALAAADASEGVIARWVGASRASGDQLRVSMTQGASGPRWAIGVQGDGIAGEPFVAGMAVQRGAGIDTNGFLVIAVADRALPDIVARALDAAGCGPVRIALPRGVLALPAGGSAGGESVQPDAETALSLVAREVPLGRRIFPEVTVVAPSVWQPVQHRQVRYTVNHGGEAGTMQVHLVGQAPVIVPIRGLGPTRDAGVAASPGGSVSPR